MKWITCFVLSFFFATALFAAPEVSYKVSVPAPWTHYVEVEMTITGLKKNEADVRMAVWTPGSYLVREYARHIDEVSATDAKGNPQLIQKTAKNRWKVALDGAKETVLKYQVYCFEHTVRTPFVDESHASLIPAGIYLYLADYEGPLQVTFEPYKEWKEISTALPEVGGDKWTRSAANLDILLDSPVELGNQDIFEFEALGMPHTMAIYGGGNYNREKLSEHISKIVVNATEVFGSNPNKDYTFILHNTSGNYGGLEHLNSTSLIFRRMGFQDPDSYHSFLGLVSHEYFHLWNVKRIRPEALGPFNYEAENYTDALWIMEGFTSYYDDLILRRSGIISEQAYLKLAAGNLNSVNNRAGNKVQAVAHASFDAWIKYYRPNENSGNTTVSYYGKGAVMAMLLDLHILHLSDGEKRLDDVLKVLWQRYLDNPEKGFTDEEFRAALNKVAGKPMDDFLDRYVHGTEIPDYKKYFDRIGMKLEDALEGIPGIRLGASIDGANKVTRIVRDMPAWKSGLNVNDEILAIDGMRYSGGIRGLLASKKEGDVLQVLVSRDGLLKTIEIALFATPRYDFKLIRNEEAGKRESKLAKIWLSIEE